MERFDREQSSQLEISLLKNVYTSERPQTLLKIMLARYGVMELNLLYEAFCVLLGAPLKYEIFEASYLAELLQTKACTDFYDGDVRYLSAYSKLEAKKILEQRQKYPRLSYPLYSREQIEIYIEKGAYCDNEAYVQLEHYLKGRRGLKKESKEYILKYVVKSGVFEKSGEGVLKTLRKISKDRGTSRIPKEMQLLILEAVKQMPIASKFGWTNQDYQHFLEDDYASMRTIQQYQQEQMALKEDVEDENSELEKEKKTSPIKRKKKEIEGQLSLFDFLN